MFSSVKVLGSSFKRKPESLVVRAELVCHLCSMKAGLASDFSLDGSYDQFKKLNRSFFLYHPVHGGAGLESVFNCQDRLTINSAMQWLFHCLVEEFS